MKKYQSKGLLENIISGFRKAAAVGAFALAGLIFNIGCSPAGVNIALQTDFAHSVSDQGRKKIEEGDLETGIRYIKEAAKIEKPDVFDSYYIGLGFKRKGDLENAEKYFRKATLNYIRKKNSNEQRKIKEKAFFELGKLYLDKDEKERALRFLKKSNILNRDNEECKGLLKITQEEVLKLREKNSNKDLKIVYFIPTA